MTNGYSVGVTCNYFGETINFSAFLHQNKSRAEFPALRENHVLDGEIETTCTINKKCLKM